MDAVLDTLSQLVHAPSPHDPVREANLPTFPHTHSALLLLLCCAQYATTHQRVRADIQKLLARVPSLKPKEDTFGVYILPFPCLAVMFLLLYIFILNEGFGHVGGESLCCPELTNVGLRACLRAHMCARTGAAVSNEGDSYLLVALVGTLVFRFFSSCLSPIAW
jgi:hypothetical protein